jgi:hypothetical protein
VDGEGHPVVTGNDGEEGGHIAVQEAGARAHVAPVPRCRGVGVGEVLDLDLTVPRDQGQGVGRIVDRDHTHQGRVRFQPARVEAREEVLYQNVETGAKRAKGAAKAEATFETVNLEAGAGVTLRQASEIPSHICLLVTSDVTLAKPPRSACYYVL